MPQQLQMLKKAAGEPIVLENILVLLLNMRLAWVICMLFPGWRTGTCGFSALYKFHVKNCRKYEFTMNFDYDVCLMCWLLGCLCLES